jgi:hypothetical protein
MNYVHGILKLLVVKCLSICKMLLYSVQQYTDREIVRQRKLRVLTYVGVELVGGGV